MSALWYLYILRCADNSLYAGITTELERRLDEHNHSNRLAAAYTRSRRPVQLIYHETYPTRSLAARREAEIKRMPRREKELLISVEEC